MKPLLTRKNVLILLGIFVSFIYTTYFSNETPHQPQTITTSAIEIPADRAQHILYGDHKGGGHKYGVGKPCKSEFPEHWGDEKILETTARIAANDNLNWEQQNNGYYVTEQMTEGTKTRVVLGRDKKTVITAYPVNRPRNPCPANDR